MTSDLLLTGGSAVTPEGTMRADIAIANGRIAGIYPVGRAPVAAQILDLTGLHVLPGLIDAHVHFREPGPTHKEDWLSGSTAAVMGGITTVLEMPNTVPPVTDPQRLTEKAAIAGRTSYVDFGLFAVIVDSNLDQIEPMQAAGAIGFKIFLGETTGNLPAPDNGGVYQAMQSVARTGLRLGFHAEDRGITDHFRARVVAEGANDLLAHTRARPSIAEAEAISRIITLAKYAGCPVHIYHLAAGEGVELIRRGQEWGVDVTAETCAQYLFLDVTDPAVAALGGLARINPPLRSREHAERLWDGLLSGGIDFIGSDHAPHAPQDKQASSIWAAACGMPGVETTLPLMLNEVNRGRLSLEHLVRLMAAGPARTWGLWPRKGALRPGADADLTVIDMSAVRTIRSAAQHGKQKFTPFDGLQVQGWPVHTIVGGRVVVRDGQIAGEPGGRWVRPIAKEA